MGHMVGGDLCHGAHGLPGAGKDTGWWLLAVEQQPAGAPSHTCLGSSLIGPPSLVPRVASIARVSRVLPSTGVDPRPWL